MTVSEIINIYPIAQYLCAIDLPKRGLSAGGVDINLADKIYNIGQSVLNRYNADPTDETLIPTSNFLYTLMGKYAIEAMASTGTGGSIAHTSTAQIPQPYNFIVSSTSFIPDGDGSKIITAFIGYNIIFSRGGITQSTIDTEPSYFSWNKQSGLFRCIPDAVDSELFIIAAI